jgi:hypothetical protein
MPTLYAVTIDTEEEWDWDAGFPVTHHSLENVSAALRFHDVCGRHGARTTWFADWAVMDDAKARGIMLELASFPDVELGMHIHPWLNPPHQGGEVHRTRESFLHNYPPDQIHAKLTALHELFSSVGLVPRSFRGGRYSTGAAVHDFLLAKDFRADSSIVPYTTWSDDGAPDYRRRDVGPKRLPRQDDGALWELPLTLGFTRAPFARWARCFELLGRSPWRYLRGIGILGRLGIVKRVWLNFEDTGPADMFDLLAAVGTLGLSYVVFTLHSSSLHRGGNPYSRTAVQVERIWYNAETVLAALHSRPDFEPATVSEIAAFLERSYESHRHQPPR